MSHYEERLDNDLARLRGAIDDLAAAVLVALRNAMRAVLEGNDELAHQTVIGDHPINRNSREIDRLCNAFIARHLPGAGHLRLMSSIIRTNVALERLGDYAVTISRESLQLSEPPPARVAKQMQALSDKALKVLEDEAVDEFADHFAESGEDGIGIGAIGVENSVPKVATRVTRTPSAASSTVWRTVRFGSRSSAWVCEKKEGKTLEPSSSASAEKASRPAG